MKHSKRPAVLILTSSFPRSPSDETCGYIRDFARCLSKDFTVEVLAPADKSAVDWPSDTFRLVRSSSILPRKHDPFQASADLNQVASASLLTKLALFVSLLFFFASALKMALRADAICSHWMVPCGLVGSLISRLLGKPHVVVEHSGALHLLGRMSGGRSIARFIADGCDRLVTVSVDLKHKLARMLPDARIEVLPMGVHSEHYGLLGTEAHPTRSDSETVLEASRRSLRPPRRTVLYLGRLTAIKGVDVLLKAMKGLAEMSLVVAGDGELRDELKMSCDSSVNAEFIGAVSARERDELLSSCDAVVIPSRVLDDGRTEGTPVVCLEALAAGRVVIAARVGGLAEVIVDGQNGLLFDPGDSRMLREKLILALSDEMLRQTISENARNTAAAYDWSSIGQRFSDIIASAIRKNDAICDRRIEAGDSNG